MFTVIELDSCVRYHDKTGGSMPTLFFILMSTRSGLSFGWMDGWMTCDFTSFLTVFQSYQEDVWMIMKGSVQWNSIYG